MNSDTLLSVKQIKTLVCTKPGVLEYVPKDMPVLSRDHAIIRIRRIGICGTDLHAFEGTQPFLSYPRILGHELSGELIEFDNAPGFKKGDTVSFIPYFHCGECVACRVGKTNCCTKLQVCGVHTDGGMAEYISVPSHLLVQSQGLSLDEMALVEPFAVGAHGVRRAMVTRDETVLVMGAGPIGLGVMEFARMAGATVIAWDINQSRLEFCTTKLKIPYAINPSDANALALLGEITRGDMASVVIDATGSLNAINSGFRLMSQGGRYVLVGLQRENISFSHPEFHKREGTLMSSRNATRVDFEQVTTAFKSCVVRPSNYITHRADFNAMAGKFENWLEPRNGVIKALVEIH